MNILARAFAVGLDGFVRDDEQLSVPERQRGVRVRMPPRSVGPGQRADEIERAVIFDRVHHHARVEVAAVRAVAVNDDVVRAEIAVGRQVLAAGIVLPGPPPARGEARTRRVREIDNDQDPISVPRLTG